MTSVASGSTLAQTPRPHRPRAGRRRSSRPSPDRARSGTRAAAASPSATASMMAAVASIPILTASTGKSASTASSCARDDGDRRHLDRRHTARVLRRDRRQHAHAEDAVGGEGLEVGLDAGAAAGVGAGDGEQARRTRTARGVPYISTDRTIRARADQPRATDHPSPQHDPRALPHRQTVDQPVRGDDGAVVRGRLLPAPLGGAEAGRGDDDDASALCSPARWPASSAPRSTTCCSTATGALLFAVGAGVVRRVHRWRAAACSSAVRRRSCPSGRLRRRRAGLAVGYAVGRLGCFLVGDDYGAPTDRPWAVAFPQGAPPSTAGELRRRSAWTCPPRPRRPCWRCTPRSCTRRRWRWSSWRRLASCGRGWPRRGAFFVVSPARA